jgi:hypothetical protein
MRTILVCNESTVVADADAKKAIAAVQKQIDGHYAPVWGTPALLVFQSGKPPAGVECVHILDTSDVAGALGYHDLAPGLFPEGFVFAKTSADDSSPWTVTLSHEVLEQLVDPWAYSCVPVGSWDGSPALLALETCDAVENDTYLIDGVSVSNFILPAWFNFSNPPGTKVDYLGKLTAPLTMDAGGYTAYTFDLVNWKQDFARQASEKSRFSRLVRRTTQKHLGQAPHTHPLEAAINWGTVIAKIVANGPAIVQWLLGGVQIITGGLGAKK